MEKEQFIQQATSVIETLCQRSDFDGTFTSHGFIGEYIKQNEHEYVSELLCYWSKPNNAFRTVNAQIALNLSKYKADLSIEKHGKAKDTNVHGKLTWNQKWNITNN